MQLSTIDASPLWTASRRTWTSTLWHWEKNGNGNEKNFLGKCPASVHVPGGVVDTSAGPLWSVTAGVRGSLHGGHKGREDNRSHSSSSWSPSIGQREGLRKVPPPQSESSSCWMKQLSVVATPTTGAAIFHVWMRFYKRLKGGWRIQKEYGRTTELEQRENWTK